MPAIVTVPRQADVDTLLVALTNERCAAVIGLSNMGKSTLLRSLSDNTITERYHKETGRRANLVYADCNRMLDLTDQGLYELILRAINESDHTFEADLRTEIETCYNNVVRPESAFDVPLNFNNAMTAILERGGRDMILLLDEFDEAFAALDGRVFLNLRALRDKYRPRLAYVTANVRRLGTFRTADDTAEFVELSASSTHILRPLHEDTARQVISGLAETAGQSIITEEIDLILEEAGGHPGLVSALTHALLRQPDAIRQKSVEALREVFDHDMVAASECVKLWRQLLLEEQEACLALLADSQPEASTLRALNGWGIVRGDTFFSTYFERFLRRQTLQTDDIPGGLVVDSDAGDIWVDGRQVLPLTDLEFRLLVLLHERLGKVTDKYRIVESVWGTDYLDEVDDSRIEKLVSRLRAKVEPDPANPRFINTVRGRGYKLTPN